MTTNGKINYREKGIDAIPFAFGNSQQAGKAPVASSLPVSLPKRRSIYDRLVYEVLNGNTESQQEALEDLYLTKVRLRQTYSIARLPYSQYIKDVQCYLGSLGLVLDKRLHRRSDKLRRNLLAIVS